MAMYDGTGRWFLGEKEEDNSKLKERIKRYIEDNKCNDCFRFRLRFDEVGYGEADLEYVKALAQGVLKCDCDIHSEQDYLLKEFTITIKKKKVN